MKKRTTTYLKYAIVFLAFSSVGKLTYAQGDAAEFIIAGKDDATKLTQAYLNPFFKGIGYGMNSAWFNSAKTKSLGKFDLRIQATGAIIPSSDKTFDVNSIGLSKYSRLRDPNNHIAQTAFGSDVDNGPELVIYDDANAEVGNLKLPSGAGIGLVPSPQIQLTVGLIKQSEISLRFTPNINVGDFGKIGSWGVGIKKEITSLLPSKSEKVIPIDLAIALGYNQINYNYNIDIADQIGENQSTNLNQRIEAKFSGFTVDAILSKKLSVFTPFVSVGYNSAKTDIGILGQYDIKSKNNSIETITDPVDINQKSISGVRANVGFGLHLAFFRLYGAYSIGEYQAFTAGIGFGIGK